jgi:hypothetical protein
MTGVLLLFLIIAVTHHVYLGSIKLLGFDLPPNIQQVLDSIRGSGRFFWPITYALSTTVMVLIWKSFSQKTGILLIGFLTVIQLVDVRTFLEAAPQPNKLQQDRLDQRAVLKDLMANHDRVVALPQWENSSESSKPFLRDIIMLASQLNKPLSIVQMARAFNPKSPFESRETYLSNGLEPETLYLLVQPQYGDADILNLDPTGEFTREIESIFVLSKSIDEYEKSSSLARTMLKSYVPKPYRLGTTIFTSELHSRNYVIGLSDKGGWSDGPRLEFVFPLENDTRPARLELKFFPFVSKQHPTQRVNVRCGEKSISTWKLSQELSFPITRSILIPGECLDDSGVLRIQLEFPDAASPKDVHGAVDSRKLALDIEEFTLFGIEDFVTLNWEKPLQFSRNQKGTKILQSGFSDPEEFGCWTVGETANLQFLLPSVGETDSPYIDLELVAFVNANHPSLRCVFNIDGEITKTEIFSTPESHRIVSIPLPNARNVVDVEIELDSPVSPASLGMSSDDRVLGLYLKKITLRNRK